MSSIEEFLTKDIFAVVGATSKTEKYGYKIYQFLKKQGKKVYPIHPAIKEIEGDPVYKTLSDLPEKVDVVDVVVPPQVTEKVVEECLKLGIKRVWMQPGAESEKAIEFCKNNDIEVVYNSCVMMH